MVSVPIPFPSCSPCFFLHFFHDVSLHWSSSLPGTHLLALADLKLSVSFLSQSPECHGCVCHQLQFSFHFVILTLLYPGYSVVLLNSSCVISAGSSVSGGVVVVTSMRVVDSCFLFWWFKPVANTELSHVKDCKMIPFHSRLLPPSVRDPAQNLAQSRQAPSQWLIYISSARWFLLILSFLIPSKYIWKIPLWVMFLLHQGCLVTMRSFNWKEQDKHPVPSKALSLDPQSFQFP